MRDVQRAALADLLGVDDEPSIRTAMVQVLTEIGYFVRSTQDGFSALTDVASGLSLGSAWALLLAGLFTMRSHRST
jgi:CheY-like chemotaxis protein